LTFLLFCGIMVWSTFFYVSAYIFWVFNFYENAFIIDNFYKSCSFFE
jgi:hypothetical protein